MKNISCVFLAILLLASCTKKAGDNPGGLTGKWTETAVYSNEFWGGPFTWKNLNRGVEVEFTTDRKYFRKPAAGAPLALVGNFKILANNQLEIEPVNSGGTNNEAYTLGLSFETDGQLILETYITEGIVKEKFRRKP